MRVANGKLEVVNTEIKKYACSYTLKAGTVDTEVEFHQAKHSIAVEP